MGKHSSPRTVFLLVYFLNQNQMIFYQSKTLMIYTLDDIANDVLNFWFDSTNQPYWFANSAIFDRQICDKFAHLIPKAMQGEMWHWRSDSYGRLAEILILDQFTRNAHRGTPNAFMGDDVALILAQEAISSPDFADLPKDFQKFTAMPFMHSESLAMHHWAVEIFKKIGDDIALDFEYKHKIIIEKFGRYPHRNAILGRASTPDELVFLQNPNSSF